MIFSGEFVKAILENRKTQTRRVIWQQPIDILPMKANDKWITLQTVNPNHGRVIKCRFGIPRDRIWVRETFCDLGGGSMPGRVLYKATFDDLTAEMMRQSGHGMPIWKPSIHMPRWASRITLEVVNVVVERVQDISEEGAIYEGMEPKEPNHVVSAKYRFAKFWDSINLKRGFGWDSNCWVWVIEFKRIG